MVQEPALDVVEYVVPATHATHTVLAVALHATLRYCPALQEVQSVGAVTPGRQKLVPKVQVPVIPVEELAQ